MSWTSPFKINLSGVGELVNAAKKTIQNAEKTIDKAIGIPDDSGDAVIFFLISRNEKDERSAN